MEKHRTFVAVVRHGEREDDVSKTADPTGNTPLTENGIAKAEEQGKKIFDEVLKQGAAAGEGGPWELDVEMFVSPFKRCRQTAAALARGGLRSRKSADLELPEYKPTGLVIDDGLSEVFGPIRIKDVAEAPQPWVAANTTNNGDGQEIADSDLIAEVLPAGRAVRPKWGENFDDALERMKATVIRHCLAVGKRDGSRVVDEVKAEEVEKKPEEEGTEEGEGEEASVPAGKTIVHLRVLVGHGDGVDAFYHACFPKRRLFSVEYVGTGLIELSAEQCQAIATQSPSPTAAFTPTWLWEDGMGSFPEDEADPGEEGKCAEISYGGLYDAAAKKIQFVVKRFMNWDVKDLVTYSQSELEIKLQTELEALEKELAVVQVEADAAEVELAANPTIEFFEQEHKELNGEIDVLEKEIAAFEDQITVLKSKQNLAFELSARVHRLENYTIRAGRWVEGTLKKDAEAEGDNAKRESELKIKDHIMAFQSARHKQQRALLELKDQIHQNAAQLVQGHTRIPRQEVKGFTKVDTARESGFGRQTTAREPRAMTARAQDLANLNMEAENELMELRAKANKTSKTRSRLQQEIKRTKDLLAKDVKRLEGDLHGFNSLIARDRRKVSELEHANATATSTLEFLMSSLKLLTGKTYADPGSMSQRTQGTVTQRSVRRIK